MYILANMWFTTLMRQFFFNIDKIVFNFISLIYDLLITIARTSVLSQADIAQMADRIYDLLTVFMIFKVILSLITYVVNPDDFSDKSKGIGKLTTNIIISLALLILTPYIFNYAYQLQTIVLEDNSLATLIFADKTEEDFFTSAGDDMAFMVMSPFFTPDTSIEALFDCTQMIVEDANGNRKFNNKCSGLNENFEKDSNVDSDKSMYSLVDDKKGRFTEQTLKNYVAGVQSNSLSLMFRQDMAVATNPKNEFYVMDYKYLFSTAIGIVVVLLLISFCMDVGVRSIKLAFLQLIAPIPILSYVDPKSGKDGLFKKWYEMCFKTFISLFVRLLAIYFAVYIISKVAKMKLIDVITGAYITNGFVAIFIIIGALMFAKQLPKILEGLGIKLDGGGFSLNPLRKMEKEALGGQMLKKPNDALAKFAKGGFGAGTMAKKISSGIDSARHGKGFKNGFDRYRGGLGKWWDKTRENWTPYSYEQTKKRREGREEVEKMRDKWARGERIRNILGGNFDNLNGLNDEAYVAAGFRGEFLASKRNLDHAAERQKILQRIYNARQMGQKVEDILKEEGGNLDKYGIDRSVVASETKLSKTLDATNKEVSGLEKVHESWRKTYDDQAEIEDAIKFNKYNPVDPTNPVRPTNSSNSGSGSTPTNNGGGSGNSPAPTNNGGGSEDVPIPQGPSEEAEKRQEAEDEAEKEKIREMISSYKEKLAEEERRMKKLIEENEEKIKVIEKQLYNATDSATKESYKKQIEALEEKNENLKKDIESYKKIMEKQIKDLEERLN